MASHRQDERRLTGPSPRGPGQAAVRADTLVVELAWGLGDVLLTTSALRRYKELHPETKVVYRTYTKNRADRTGGYRIIYEKGCPAEMLHGNPDIDQIEDIATPHRVGAVKFSYAWFGGPSLDYPIQAHYWENLGLKWQPGQRFDSYFYLTDEEREWADHTLRRGPILAIAPACGWPGKEWRQDRWAEVIRWATESGYEVAVLAGERLTGPPWDARGVRNFTSLLDMRKNAAILDAADKAVLIEGGLSNLRFALGWPAVLLTCATKVGLQIWTPPELTTEIRMMSHALHEDASEAEVVPGVDRFQGYARVACEPCMWRREHPKTHTRNVAPASIAGCPPGRSLRDVPADVVITALEGG